MGKKNIKSMEKKVSESMVQFSAHTPGSFNSFEIKLLDYRYFRLSIQWMDDALHELCSSNSTALNFWMS